MTVSELVNTDSDVLLSAGVDALVALFGGTAELTVVASDTFTPDSTRVALSPSGTVTLGISIPDETELIMTGILYPDPETAPEEISAREVAADVIERFFSAVGETASAPLTDSTTTEFSQTVSVTIGEVTLYIGIAASSGGATSDSAPTPRVSRLADVKLHVSVELGRTQIPVKDLLALDEGGVIRLGRAVGQPVDLVVNGTITAHGEIVVVDGRLGLKITSLA